MFLRLHLREKPLQEKKRGYEKLTWPLFGDRLGVVREQVVYTGRITSRFHFCEWL